MSGNGYKKQMFSTAIQDKARVQQLYPSGYTVNYDKVEIYENGVMLKEGKEDFEFFPYKEIVEIEYNKNTGLKFEI